MTCGRSTAISAKQDGRSRKTARVRAKEIKQQEGRAHLQLRPRRSARPPRGRPARRGARMRTQRAAPRRRRLCRPCALPGSAAAASPQLAVLGPILWLCAHRVERVATQVGCAVKREHAERRAAGQSLPQPRVRQGRGALRAVVRGREGGKCFTGKREKDARMQTGLEKKYPAAARTHTPWRRLHRAPPPAERGPPPPPAGPAAPRRPGCGERPPRPARCARAARAAACYSQ